MAQICDNMRLWGSRRLDSTKRWYKVPRGILENTAAPHTMRHGAAWASHVSKSASGRVAMKQKWLRDVIIGVSGTRALETHYTQVTTRRLVRYRGKSNSTCAPRQNTGCMRVITHREPVWQAVAKAIVWGFERVNMTSKPRHAYPTFKRVKL